MPQGHSCGIVYGLVFPHGVKPAAGRNAGGMQYKHYTVGRRDCKITGKED